MSVRLAIVDLVAGVAGVGIVHAFERYAKDEAKFRTLYVTDQAVRGWHVQRLAARRRLLASGRELVTESWVVTGFVSMVDAEASELDLSNLVDAVMAAERADPTLGGKVRGREVDGAVGFQLIDFGPVMFAGVLCQRARLSLFTQKLESAIDGDFGAVDGAADSLNDAVVARLHEELGDQLQAIEGRLSWDPDDDPAAFPAAIVTPIGDTARLDPTSVDLDERVDVRLAVTLVGSGTFAQPDGGSVQAGGLEALAAKVRTALHGWQPAQVDVPLLYAGAGPVDAARGLFAWRLTFQPSSYIQDEIHV